MHLDHVTAAATDSMPRKHFENVVHVMGATLVLNSVS